MHRSFKITLNNPLGRASYRLQRYASAAKDIPPVTQTNRAETSMTRFWKSAHVKEGEGYLEVTLDGRALKTPEGNKLRLPPQKKVLATLIANEWDIQDTALKPHTLPLTSIAARAIDGLSNEEQRKEVVNTLLRYFDTDAICYHEEEPRQLRRLQEEHWKPLIDWSRKDMGLDTRLFDSILIGKQSSESKARLFSILKEFDQWKLAGYERAVYTTKSALISLALTERRLTVDQASQAAHVEVNSQIERWGEVEDSHDVDYQDMRRQLGSVACVLLDS